MLLYTIKPKGTFLTALDNLTKRNTSRNSTSHAYGEGDMPWDKFQFNTWFKEHVQDKFQVGDLLCSQISPEDVPTLIPWHWRLEFINEVYKDVKFNNVYHQPVVLNCKDVKSGAWYYKCPGNVRKLTKGELALVNLQNSKVQGHA